MVKVNLIFKADKFSNIMNAEHIDKQVYPKLLALTLFIAFSSPILRELLCSFLLLFICKLYINTPSITIFFAKN